MKITKYVHSCLLVREKGKTVLIDPGNYTFEEKVLDVGSLTSLDYLLITHEHLDHMYPPLIKVIVKKFPDVKIISNEAVKSILEKEGINVATTVEEFIEIEEVPHEKLPFWSAPQNSLFRIGKLLTHPGDSHHFAKTTPVLALPIQAAWGSTAEAIVLAQKLKPKFIIPIHDWHLNEKAKEAIYQQLASYFATQNIIFLKIRDSETVTLESQIL